MKFVYYPCDSRKATLRVTIDAGSAVEYGGEWTPGIAHVVEHMIFQGTNFMTHEELTKAMGGLGVDMNGATWHAKVAYYLTSPAENIFTAAKLLSEMLFNRKFDKATLDKEKLVILEEKRGSEDDIESKITEKFDKFLCDGPIAEPVIGTVKSIKSIKLEEVQAFFDYYYKSERMLVTLTGSISGVSPVGEAIVNLFGKNNKNFKKSGRTKNLHSELVKKSYTGSVQQATIYMAYKAIPLTNKDAFTLVFINKFLGEDMDSRLFQSLREKHGLCYGVGGYPYLCDDIGWFVIWTKTSKENVEQAINLIDEEIIKLTTECSTEEEINRAKNKYLSEIYSFLETSAGTNALISNRHYNGLPDIEKTLEWIKSINATEIIKICKKYFKPENRKIFTYLPKTIKEK